MRRIVRSEWLDTQQASDIEVKQSLEDLWFVNRWFGGYSTTKTLIQRVLSKTQLPSLSILDVGSASGDGAEYLQNAFPAVKVRFTLLDRVAAHFNGSRHTTIAGDAIALPFLDQSFDVVMCSLFAHHLEPDEFRQFAKEALRISRVGLLVNDLSRSYFHLGLIYAGMPLFRSRATRHDSVASVWRAYTPSEMESMLKGTSAARVEVHSTYLCRLGAIAWK